MRGNRDGLEDFVSRTEGLGMSHVDATYLAWIDCRNLPAENPTLFFEDAGVGLSDGNEFGAAGFVRLNFGCPRSMLSKAILRMERAVLRLSSQRRQV